MYTYRRVLSSTTNEIVRNSDGCGLRTAASDGCRWVPIYSMPVSGSTAAPAQLAPPALPLLF